MENDKIEMSREELKELFKATAAGNTVAGKELAAAITTPILQQVRDASRARQLFATEVLEPGAQASYPVADDYEAPVFVLSKLGYVPQHFVELAGEEIYLPTFRIGTSADWSLDYAREGRIDIAQRAMRNAARAVIDYEEESAWRILAPACTSAWPGKGLVPPRPAPLVQETGLAAGFLSKELINAMIVKMERQRRTLTDLYVSPEDASDLREWNDSEIDETTRREIYVRAGATTVFNVKMSTLPQLGATGRYNINSADSEYGIFRVGSNGKFNDYAPTNANKVDANGNVVALGETQIYGLDLSVNDSLVMPIRQELEFFDDPTLHRSQKQGFYGWETVGFGCLDPRMLVMGVIDRK